jgi:hypothetical protein
MKNNNQNDHLKRKYTQEDIINFRVAKEVINLRLIPAMWGIGLTSLGVILIIIESNTVQSQATSPLFDFMSFIVGICLIICGGFVAITRVPILIFFLFTKEYWHSRNDAKKYNESISDINEHELKRIIIKAKERVSIPFHIRVSSNISLPDQTIINPELINSNELFERHNPKL